MDAKQFNLILDRRLNCTKSVLGVKAGEYASSADRLHNFKKSAAVLNTTPELALLGFLTKHLVSVIDLVQSENIPIQSVVDEKVGNCINYLILLEALWHEKYSEMVLTNGEAIRSRNDS